MKLKLVFFITILLLMHNSGWAQSIQMRVCKKDGTVHVFNIEEIRKLTFADEVGFNEKQFNAVIKNFYLLKNYPNPFQSSTTISYTLPSEGTVEISVIDLFGKIVQTIPSGHQLPGEHFITWEGKTDNGQKVQTGIYFCKVRFNNQIQTNKMIIIN